MDNAQRAEVLTQALPYIQKYTDKIIVVKYGGNAMINDELKDAVMGDIVLLSLIGIKVVLVHGGGPEITQMLKAIGFHFILLCLGNLTELLRGELTEPGTKDDC